MADVEITYKGSKIVEMSASGTKTLETAGTYCEDDLELKYTSPGGGGATLITKNISANGTYNASSDSADGYSSVTVAVPNTYTAGDEGKVVSSGALVSQSSTTKNANGTYDTTLNNEVVISVPNSYSAADEGKVVSNGALVSQTSDTVTVNDTYDTTLINSLTVAVSGGGSSLLGFLDYVEYTMATDATQSNRQSINLTAISGTYYVLFLAAKTMPSAPASGFTAISGVMHNMGLSGASYDRKSSIMRADGTIGTDGNMFNFTPSTGVLQIGGQYGTFRTGQVFDIYLFELM